MPSAATSSFSSVPADLAPAAFPALPMRTSLSQKPSGHRKPTLLPAPAMLVSSHLWQNIPGYRGRDELKPLRRQGETLQRCFAIGLRRQQRVVTLTLLLQHVEIFANHIRGTSDLRKLWQLASDQCRVYTHPTNGDCGS